MNVTLMYLQELYDINTYCPERRPAEKHGVSGNYFVMSEVRIMIFGKCTVYTRICSVCLYVFSWIKRFLLLKSISIDLLSIHIFISLSLSIYISIYLSFYLSIYLSAGCRGCLRYARLQAGLRVQEVRRRDRHHAFLWPVHRTQAHRGNYYWENGVKKWVYYSEKCVFKAI